jgi:Holliday junction resolvasome RuvABC endonuclease subunit
MARYQCRLIVAELPTGGSKSSRAASMMAMASAVTFCLSISRKVPLVCMRPAQTKALVRAKGEVSKQEVQDLVRAHYPHGAESLWPKNASREHVADAMACWMAYEKAHQ